MKHTLVAVTLLSLSTIAAIPACAQTMKPGLWEMQSSLGKGWGKAMAGIQENNKKMMAGMSAESRKEMEAYEAEQKTHTRYTDDHVIVKMCVTKEQAAKFQMANLRDKMKPDGKCTEKVSPTVGGVTKFDHKCTNPASTGITTLRLRGDTGFDIEMTSTTSVQGERHTMNGTMNAKWVGANCGNVEPDDDGE